MPTLFVAIAPFTFFLGGQVKKFERGALIEPALRARFGDARLPLVPPDQASTSLWCPACKTMDTIGPLTCSLVDVSVYSVSRPVKVTTRFGGLRSFAGGEFIADAMDVEALRLGNVLLDAVPDVALCVLRCRQCGAERREFRADDFVRERLVVMRAEKAETAHRVEVEAAHILFQAEQRAQQRARSYERIAEMKAKQSSETQEE